MKLLSILTSFSIFLLTACGSEQQPDTKLTVNEDRPNPNKNAVAALKEDLTDTDMQKLNQFVFKAELFETSKTFEYDLKFEYETQQEKSKVYFPNLGYEPKPQIQAGKEPHSMIIGFLDDKGIFKELMKLYVDANGNIGLKPLKKYVMDKK